MNSEVSSKTRIAGRLLSILGALALLAVIAAFFFFLGIGKWLVKEDPLQKATAIAVLKGNFPERAVEAAMLYREGYAKEIWLTYTGTEVLKFGVRYPSETDCNLQVLGRLGVPAKAIRVLESPVQNTADELDLIGVALRDVGGESVILVTDKLYTRRLHSLWREIEADRGKAIIHGVTESSDPSWWKTTGGTRQVMHEVFALLNFSFGLPMQTDRPSRRSVARK